LVEIHVRVVLDGAMISLFFDAVAGVEQPLIESPLIGQETALY